jgi:L-Ala-D/L-Glu epimerase / N-acetyl-D-glutamate racemase
MKVESFRVYRCPMTYKEPFRIALGSSADHVNIVLELEAEDGTHGYGEGSAAPRITGDTPESVVSTLRSLASAVIGIDVFNIEGTVDRILKIKGSPAAKAAVDMALHDLWGRALGRPLYRLLGGYRERIETDITIGIKKPAEMAASAKRAVAEGFKIIKVKVGTKPQEDIERVRRIRDAVGERIRLRVDANQAWSVREAVETIERIERFNPEFIEQPVKAENVKGLAAVAGKVEVPIMADESMHTPADALRLVKENAADMFNIKLMKSSGIHAARKIAAIADAAEIPCMVGCMAESTVGITAALHFVLAHRIIQYADLDCDLLLTERAVRLGGAQIKDGVREPTLASGLGIIELDRSFMKPVFSL